MKMWRRKCVDNILLDIFIMQIVFTPKNCNHQQIIFCNWHNHWTYKIWSFIRHNIIVKFSFSSLAMPTFWSWILFLFVHLYHQEAEKESFNYMIIMIFHDRWKYVNSCVIVYVKFIRLFKSLSFNKHQNYFQNCPERFNIKHI